MRSERRLRRLVVDGTTTGETTAYLWSVRHRHRTDGPCQEVLALTREGTTATVHLVFRGGEGRLVPDGFLHSGAVALGGHAALNLHEPGVVRAFVDEAVRRGLLTGAAELDGWELFPAVAAARAADG
ncbi:hypothetical protein JL475_26210 [Streptomyces sp. M2CJ-2]|uniref:hypothetical protein n=1 Tax=Streptomyces sp. M2CJ-2 TaxID=2803948 RepID=UPI0019253618|nr:hypothetical protein [Streptomyces sp. M2CJ-2]MBL3669415.1 hypothetical protein [Streptomyces sp. M2CJ-2]